MIAASPSTIFFKLPLINLNSTSLLAPLRPVYVIYSVKVTQFYVYIF